MGTSGIKAKNRYVFVAIACLLMVSVSATALAARGTGRPPTVKKVSLLYALEAGSGMLVPEKGKGSSYRLVLEGLDRNVTWFSDRPARRSGSFAVPILARSWKGFGFTSDPPNAALTYSEKGGGSARTVIVEISHPSLARGRLSFAVRVLDPKAIKAGNLAAHATAADRDPARALVDASLFIDDTTAKLVGGCIMQPSTRCEGADLGAIDLYGADLWGAN